MTNEAAPETVRGDEGVDPAETNVRTLSPGVEALPRWWDHARRAAEVPGDSSFGGQAVRIYRTARDSNSRWKHLPIALLAAAYIFWFSLQSLRMYNGYSYPPFDLAIFDQGLWQLSHFHAPFVTVMGRNLFGDHTSFILLLLVPFYRLVPEPQGILLVQAWALGAAALPIYAIARRLTKSVTIATVIGAVYLLNPAIQQGNLEQFHPEALQVPIITLAIYAALESRGWMLAVTVALALLVKEDAAVLVIPLGVWVLCRRDWKWGLKIIAVATGYALIANEVIIPGILGTSSFYSGRIPFGGPGGFLTTLLRQPSQVWAYLREGGRPFYVWQMGFATGWGFLLSPEIALVGAFALLENVLSDDPYMHQIVYHYSMSVVPALVIGVAWAIGRQRRQWRRVALAGTALVCAIWSCSLWGMAPFSANSTYVFLSPGSAGLRAVNYVEAAIPSNAVVSAWYPYVSHLDHREQVYVWPNPYSASNWGLLNDTGVRLPQSSQVKYLMLPLPLGSDNNQSVLASILPYYRLVRSRDGVALYERRR